MDLFQNEPENVLLPLPSQADVDRLLAAIGPDKTFERLKALCKERRESIARAAIDPVRFAPRPKLWRLPARILRNPSVKTFVLLGGNRSTKSYWAAYAILDTALGISAGEVAANEGVTFLVVSESLESSRATAQRILWTIMPQRIKALNGRKSKNFYIHYSIKEGFGGDAILVLPSGVEIKFVSYNQDPDDWEGRELGLKNRRAIAWWADENMPLPWFLMLRRRGQYRQGFGAWSFTPIHGITEAIKEAVGAGKAVRTRRAHLLPAQQVLVPGLPPGRVPLIQRGADSTTSVCYFHSDLTPFMSGDRKYSELVADLVRGKTKDYILAVYYGYTLDVAGRAWPKYSRDVHMIPRAALPWDGTNYLFVDPAGGRSWFMLWVRVAPGNPRRCYIYRDWPDKHRHGEWAVPTVRQLNADSRKGRDGDAGPAQRNPGWGVARYKQQMLREETIDLDLDPSGMWREPDPLRRQVLNRAMKANDQVPVKEWVGAGGCPECSWSKPQVEAFRAVHPEPVREPIRIRFIDPRAAGQPQAAAKGGTTLVSLFAQEQRRADGELEGPRMFVMPAFSGKERDEGIRAVNDLLDYDHESPVVQCLNEPRLYVAEGCDQVDWVLTHYTGEGAEDDGGKDPADLLRYVAITEDVRHVAGGKLITGGFKDGI